MSCLLYCICSGQAPLHPTPVLGVGGQPVFLVTQGNLRAAVSRTSPTLALDLSGLKAYGRVVASFHLYHTVIPVRYGCVLPDESQVTWLLENHRPEYEALLTELAGCVEMGLRVKVDPGLPGLGEMREPERAPVTPSSPELSGAAYLLARRVHYAALDQGTQLAQSLAAEYLDHFNGLFIKSKIEGPLPQMPLLSLYFLVPANQVEAFRQAYRRLRPSPEAGTLLSGPWPPYNFVMNGFATSSVQPALHPAGGG
ncbi:MAG: GvpL/GvpF family gas vesicle protein [Desulfobaccales bacterium]